MATLESTNDTNKTAPHNEEDETTIKPKTYLDNLNNDCLIAIFKLLDEIDLFRLCEYNDRFRWLVVNCVVPGKLFDFSNLRQYDVHTEKVFELFCEKFTKIKINGHDIRYTKPQHTQWEEFLSLVHAHCTVDKIIDLDIRFQLWSISRNTEQLFAQAIPFFRKVANLRIDFTGDSYDTNRFLKMIPLGNARSI